MLCSNAVFGIICKHPGKDVVVKREDSKFNLEGVIYSDVIYNFYKACYKTLRDSYKRGPILKEQLSDDYEEARSDIEWYRERGICLMATNREIEIPYANNPIEDLRVRFLEAVSLR